MSAKHPSRLVAVAAALLLAGCTAPAADAPVQPPAASPAGATASPAPTGVPTTDPASPTASPTGSGDTAPATAATIVLSGTAIGGRALERASVKDVDTLVGARLGTPKVGQPELCRRDGQNSVLAVVTHTWSGLTVRFASAGGAAVAIGWTVDATHVPKGVRLAGNLPWRPPFTTLQRLGAELSRNSGTRYAQLAREQLTYSAPAGAELAHAVSGGPILTCG
jgi:hypothetical protein